MAVDVTRDLVVVSGVDDRLHVYALAADSDSDGTGSEPLLRRSFGGRGAGPGQFHWAEGGLCMTPRGTLLVAEHGNDRVQEVNIDDGAWVRFLGCGVLEKPNFVDCSESVIAVSESVRHHVALLSWEHGALLARVGGRGAGDGQLNTPYGLRLLANGSGVVVADFNNHRLCVFALTGSFVRAVPAGKYPSDVVECDGGAGFVVANLLDGTLSKVPAAATTGANDISPSHCSCGGPSRRVMTFGTYGAGAGQLNLNSPVALAVVPRGDLMPTRARSLSHGVTGGPSRRGSESGGSLSSADSGSDGGDSDSEARRRVRVELLVREFDNRRVQVLRA